MERRILCLVVVGFVLLSSSVMGSSDKEETAFCGIPFHASFRGAFAGSASHPFGSPDEPGNAVGQIRLEGTKFGSSSERSHDKISGEIEGYVVTECSFPRAEHLTYSCGF